MGTGVYVSPGQPSAGSNSRGANLCMERTSKALGVQQRNKEHREQGDKLDILDSRLRGALSSWRQTSQKQAFLLIGKPRDAEGMWVCTSLYTPFGSICICALRTCRHV